MNMPSREGTAMACVWKISQSSGITEYRRRWMRAAITL